MPHVINILPQTGKGNTISVLHLSHVSRYKREKIKLTTVSAKLNSAALLLVIITSESDESELDC